MTHSYAVIACANICSDLVATDQIARLWISNKIWIVTQYLEKWDLYWNGFPVTLDISEDSTASATTMVVINETHSSPS